MNDKATILAVDDTPESLALLVKILTPAGYQVHPADSGELALAAVAANPPDLILLDVRMKGVDGLEVCRLLKAREETRRIPIILVSAFADVKEWVAGLQLGAADYITKPFQTEELLTRVKTHLALSRATVSLEQQTAALRRTNEQLQSEIVERRRVEDELRRSLDRAERSRRAMLSTVEDQKRAVEALRQSEEKFSTAFQTSPYAITITRPEDGQFVEVNDAFTAMTGFTREEALAGSSVGLNLWVNQEDRQRVVADLRAGRAVVSQEYPFRTMSGEVITGLFSAQAIQLSGGPCILSSINDITERKRAEVERDKLQTRLTQAQKMESVGRLAGGVAHDFNNMLTVIIGHTELAVDQVDPAQPLWADLREIRQAAERSADLTRQLLAFARKQIVAPKVLDLNATVESMLKMLRRLIGEDIDLAWCPGARVEPVKVDPSQIDQILANLCVNARDAIVGVGKVTIETSNVAFDAAYCAAHPGSVPGEYVLLAVSDDGCGMDQETLDRLFEPFFTTKEMGKGTGLGLATVYGIVKQNNGFINVYSEPSQGTTFTIYLPRHGTPAEQIRPERPAAPAARGHETILLVEDEPAVLSLTARVLEPEGYTVLAASTPGEAIRLAREHAGEIHLLMTDVVMPEMNGRDLAKNLLALYPRLKRLFMSGYTANVIAHRGVLDEGVQFIQKPFSIQDLAAKVREVLDTE